MSEDFRKKLRDYADNKLSKEERIEMDRELEKIEIYQSFLDEEMKGQDTPADKERPKGRDDIQRKQRRIIRKGKWKARVQNAITAVSIILAVMVISSICTSLFYTTGKPSRLEVYRDVVASAVAVTRPNIQLRGSGTQVNSFFTMRVQGDLLKRVGSEDIKSGEIAVSFLLNRGGYPEWKWSMEGKDSYIPFNPIGMKYDSSASDWTKLEKLPEGTVAEAYLSFHQLFSTDDVLQKFKDKDMRLLWFAVDTGFDDASHQREDGGIPPIGFPYDPVWHYDDWTVTSHTEKKGIGFSKSITESAEAPSLDPYGSGDLRNKNFLKTLQQLEKHEDIANRVAFWPELRLKQRIQYLKDHGVYIYGAVVTGPTKEILKLKQESWVSGMRLGEVRLWNWDSNLK